MDIPILYEDAALLVIDKPPGLVVNRAESAKGPIIQDWAAERFGFATTGFTDPDSFDARAGVVHRLDKETSGILLLAKTPEAFVVLQGQFKSREIHKTYLAVVHGIPENGHGLIDAPVGRLPWNRTHFGVLPEGREATSEYQVLKTGILSTARKAKGDQNISLVEVFPKTGRTHQIRVHFQYLGHPLVGDELYAGRKTSRDDRYLVPRILLHAWKIEFAHPTTGKTMKLEAPIPDDMQKVTRSMRAYEMSAI